MNLMTEKTNDEVDKLTYHYLELSETPKDEISPENNTNNTKYSKFNNMHNTNNFYTGLLYPDEPFENHTYNILS